MASRACRGRRPTRLLALRAMSGAVEIPQLAKTRGDAREATKDPLDCPGAVRARLSRRPPQRISGSASWTQPPSAIPGGQKGCRHWEALCRPDLSEPGSQRWLQIGGQATDPIPVDKARARCRRGARRSRSCAAPGQRYAGSWHRWPGTWRRTRPAVKFDPRSRMRNLMSSNRSSRVRARLRACCTVHSPVGLAVTPPRCIRRVPCSHSNHCGAIVVGMTGTFTAAYCATGPAWPGRRWSRSCGWRARCPASHRACWGFR